MLMVIVAVIMITMTGDGFNDGELLGATDKDGIALGNPEIDGW